MLITIDESFRTLSQHLQGLSRHHRILVATDNRPYALALASCFALHHDEHPSRLVGIATTQREALACLDEVRGPLLAFVSERLDEGRGFDLITELKQRSVHQSPIDTVFTLEQTNPLSIKQAIAGPSNVILTRGSLDLMTIVNAVESILEGVRFVDPSIFPALQSRNSGQAHALSDRERMVLQQLCNGLTNREIGEALTIAETTARGHVQSIMRKLNVKDRTAAAVEAIRRHWVD
ncbi:LuxR C-terminal-related transcriptional regulator [Synechococcus sp. W2B2]|uniref:helix-turn-helix transcriptional regulator n=1 Tax=unclassified Synechococcus TaxID=2626047 RepID=UPI00006BB2E3|nr:response regulator transcription factor [Synechococcus sp. WH 7805]EAR19691.1 response regulator like protein [Synechococcus sp. WH 7805]